MSSFQLGSGREALAPLSAATLEDRAAGAGRHPRAKSVPALAASNVRLEGAFHEAEGRGVGGRRPSPATGQYREAHPADRLRSVPRPATSNPADAKSGRPGIHRPNPAWGKALNHLSTAVETAVERAKSPARRMFFLRGIACFQALSGLSGVAMIAASRSLAEGASTRRATPC